MRDRSRRNSRDGGTSAPSGRRNVWDSTASKRFPILNSAWRRPRPWRRPRGDVPGREPLPYAAAAASGRHEKSAVLPQHYTACKRTLGEIRGQIRQGRPEGEPGEVQGTPEDHQKSKAEEERQWERREECVSPEGSGRIRAPSRELIVRHT